MDKNNLDEINIEYGSHNVFADLGLENADELLTRAQLIVKIISITKERNYDQCEASRVLGISQCELSNLYSGKITEFSMEKLISFLNLLDWKIQFKISPRYANEPLESVDFQE